MEGKKIVLVVSIILCIGIVILFVYNMARNQVARPYSDIIQAVTAFQRAVKNKDIKILWELSGKVKRQKSDNNYDKFKEMQQKWFLEYSQEVYAYSNARLEKVRIITPNRAWVECKSSMNRFKGFYMIKEDGKWKYCKISIYIAIVTKDIEFLNEAIKKYYTNKNRLPYTLVELVPDYIESLPLDHFSDEKKNYSYEILGETSWKIYSVGVDSHDNFGVMQYDDNPELKDGGDFDFATGDIISENKISE